MLKLKPAQPRSPKPASLSTRKTLLSLLLIPIFCGCASLHGVPSKDRKMPPPNPEIMEPVDYREMWLEKMRCLGAILDKPPKQSCETPPNE